MTAAAPLIEVERISVRLRRDAGYVRSLRELVVHRLQRRAVRPQWIRVLDEVSFTIDAGELFAIIGRNGAGKTTLLRVLAGIVPAETGRVRVRGVVAPLIELGAGFDPELTGTENVLLYGALLGMRTAALKRSMDDIFDFAGVGFAAHAPLKTYSSGMTARLGFAVATAVRPDVLLIDEVLAVGDEAFRAQCRRRIDELRNGGSAVVLVTHDLDVAAREATRVAVLDQGRLCALGAAAEAVSEYRKRVAA